MNKLTIWQRIARFFLALIIVVIIKMISKILSIEIPALIGLLISFVIYGAVMLI